MPMSMRSSYGTDFGDPNNLYHNYEVDLSGSSFTVNGQFSYLGTTANWTNQTFNIPAQTTQDQYVCLQADANGNLNLFQGTDPSVIQLQPGYVDIIYTTSVPHS
jgi:hypothetical protein